MSKRMCRRGHDTELVGRDSSGWCSECRRISERSPDYRPRSPFCPKGHDKRIVGSCSNGRCRACNNRSKLLRDFDEVVVYHERLPIEPLIQKLRDRKIPLRSALSRTNERLLHRSVQSGYISVMKADEICIEALGCHPLDVWGPDWFELKPIKEAA